MRSKLDAHHKEIRLVASILPVSKLILETGAFDPHALKDPAVLEKKSLDQKGPNYGYENIRAFVVSRDGYLCQHCKEWKCRVDADACIRRMKDGCTHMAHKAEHAMDMGFFHS